MRGDGHAGSLTGFLLPVTAFFRQLRRLRPRPGCRRQRRLRRNAQRAPAERRGKTASSFFVVLYVGLSTPVIAAGAAIHYTSLRSAGIGFCAGAGTLALAVLVSQLGSRAST